MTYMNSSYVKLKEKDKKKLVNKRQKKNNNNKKQKQLNKKGNHYRILEDFGSSDF